MAYLREFSGGKAAFENVPKWLLSTAEAGKWTQPDPSVYGNQSDLYRKLSWVTTACEAVADVGASVPFNVLRKVGEDEKDIPNHPFELLLDKPNPLDSRSEFLKATIIMMMLNGNSYWWMNKKNEYEPPEELWYIPPHMIIPNPDGKLYLKNYLYYPGTGEELTFEPWEIVHFRRFNPFSRFLGLSAIESIALVAFGDIGMASWNSKLFQENNGRLPGMVTFEQFVPDDSWEIIKNDMNEAARKRAFLMLRGVGQGGVQWHQNAVSQRDMEFLEGRKMNRDEIWNVLAKGLVSYLSESSTEANSRTGESAFERLSVYPKLSDIAEKITNEILGLYGGRKLVGRFEDMRKVDQAMELEKNKEFAKFHTIEEVRKQVYGDEPLGDERDDLLVDQVQSNSGAKAETPQNQNPFEQQNQNPFAQNLENNPPQEETPQQAFERIANGKSLVELDQFQKKALKSIGKDVSFENTVIPEGVLDFIHLQLPSCDSVKMVNQIFKQARRMVFHDFKETKEDAKTLADSINNLVKVINGDVQPS